MKKKSTFLLGLVMVITLAGCGDTYSESAADNAESAGINNGYMADENGYADESYEDADEAEPEENTSSSVGTSLPSEENRADTEIDREMLVYTCDMSIDTLDFDKAVGDFKAALVQAGGFVENETYDDGYYGSSYLVKEEDKDRTYRATVRVPSKQYNSFLEGTEALGDVRSKSAYVENLSQEYSDLGTSLEIYEAKEKRYINLLSTITDDEYAIEVERELTELQIQIAQIKTRMNKIRTDVAYSYVNVTIHAVREYVKEPVKDDTFGQRLVNQLHSTWKGFLWFLETLLFVFIGVSPYLAIMAVIVLVIIKIANKKSRKRVLNKNPNPVTANENMVQPPLGADKDKNNNGT